MASATQATAPEQKRTCKSCAAVLSRYNPDSLCMPCQTTQQREKLAEQFAAAAGEPVQQKHRDEAARISEGLTQRRLAVSTEPEQRWCDGCQKFRFAGAWGKRGICRFCEEKPVPELGSPTEVIVTSSKDPAAVALGRRGGQKGGPARAAALTPEQRQEAGRSAAQARWSKGVEPVIAEGSSPSATETLAAEVVQESTAEPTSELPVLSEETVVRAPNALLPDQWSRLYERCVQCGRIDSPHASKGFCTRCRNEIRGRQTAELIRDMHEGNKDIELADYQVLYRLLGILPKDGRWNSRQHALWLRGFTSLLDYLTEEPSCESVGHHACPHYVKVAENAIALTRDTDFCGGCGAERPYSETTETRYTHKQDCPMAQIVEGEL